MGVGGANVHVIVTIRPDFFLKFRVSFIIVVCAQFRDIVANERE